MKLTYICWRNCFHNNHYFKKGDKIDLTEQEAKTFPKWFMTKQIPSQNPADDKMTNTKLQMGVPRDFISLMNSMPREKDDYDELVKEQEKEKEAKKASEQPKK